MFGSALLLGLRDGLHSPRRVVAQISPASAGLSRRFPTCWDSRQQRRPVLHRRPGRLEIGETAQRGEAAIKLSLSSIGWRRGPGRGGAFVSSVLKYPSPRSSPHSSVVGRGRRQRALENLRSAQRFWPILIDWKSALRPNEWLPPCAYFWSRKNCDLSVPCTLKVFRSPTTSIPCVTTTQFGAVSVGVLASL